ncbi:MAG: GC-type dockerin domain-anchored protein, partial [Planctomycetota bacterium]
SNNDAIATSTVEVIIPINCVADVNGDNVLDIDDFSAFVTAFFANDMRADQDSNRVLDIDDFSAFVSNFFSGCDN